MTLLKNIGKYLLKGCIYSVAFGIIGAVFAMINGWVFLKGAYIFVLGGGALVMVISVALLIGTPKMREEMVRSGDQFQNPSRGAEGIGPAIMAMTMIIIGFWLEALMH
ncbi:hypothetical protein [Thermotalea metallivorans]|uniref:Uncharacterized protein n=1 Tax=Thermotalea metallivorans TaxID=520762 RepID=A0A140L7Q5_9FIRM|nr:hypothetical protein [Thermotalea metallivorans]KXG76580.1 hypothetical protein AN619_09050 [Thermotalea metallivorans]